MEVNFKDFRMGMRFEFSLLIGFWKFWVLELLFFMIL